MKYEYANVRVDSIKPDPKQPRVHKDIEKAKELAQTIKTEGIINPIEIDEDKVIITGETRWRAAKIAGLKVIPCKIVRGVAGRDRLRRQVIENIYNNTMNSWDTAVALGELIKRYLPETIVYGSDKHVAGMKKLAKEVGKSYTFVRQYLDILVQTEPIQKAIKEGMPRTHLEVFRLLPVKYHKKLEEKVLKEKVEREGLREIARAIDRNEEKADEILSIDYTGKKSVEVAMIVRQISPSFTDVLPSAKSNAKELTALLIKVSTLLNTNKLDDFPEFYKPVLRANIIVSMNHMKSWLKHERSKLKFEELTDGKK